MPFAFCGVLDIVKEDIRELALDFTLLLVVADLFDSHIDVPDFPGVPALWYETGFLIFCISAGNDNRLCSKGLPQDLTGWVALLRQFIGENVFDLK